METHEWVTTTQRHDHLCGQQRVVTGVAHSTGAWIGREYQRPDVRKTTTPEFPANDPSQSGSVLRLQHQTMASPKLLGAANSLPTACAQLDALLAEAFPCAPSKGSDECKLHARERNTGGCSAEKNCAADAVWICPSVSPIRVRYEIADEIPLGETTCSLCTARQSDI